MIQGPLASNLLWKVIEVKSKKLPLKPGFWKRDPLEDNREAAFLQVSKELLNLQRKEDTCEGRKLRLSRSLSRFETQDIKTQLLFNHYLLEDYLHKIPMENPFLLSPFQSFADIQESKIINGIPREKEKNKKINETIKCMKEKKEKLEEETTCKKLIFT